jgi:hypothetical protein
VSRPRLLPSGDLVYGRGERTPAAAPWGWTTGAYSLRVPETRFGVSERVLAGSSGVYLMLLLTV